MVRALRRRVVRLVLLHLSENQQLGRKRTSAPSGIAS